MPFQFHAEQSRRSKLLQHDVLCIGELLDLSKSFRSTIDVHIKMKDTLVQHLHPRIHELCPLMSGNGRRDASRRHHQQKTCCNDVVRSCTENTIGAYCCVAKVAVHIPAVQITDKGN